MSLLSLFHRDLPEEIDQQTSNHPSQSITHSPSRLIRATNTQLITISLTSLPNSGSRTFLNQNVPEGISSRPPSHRFLGNPNLSLIRLGHSLWCGVKTSALGNFLIPVLAKWIGHHHSYKGLIFDLNDERLFEKPFSTIIIHQCPGPTKTTLAF